uniref:Uncharacterized protein n=1 Tax=Hucho hucho TaxID=62062 RepID=A0A4W5KFM0_9TELE
LSVTADCCCLCISGHKSKHSSRLRKKGPDLSELQSAIDSIKKTQENIYKSIGVLRTRTAAGQTAAEGGFLQQRDYAIIILLILLQTSLVSLYPDIPGLSVPGHPWSLCTRTSLVSLYPDIPGLSVPGHPWSLCPRTSLVSLYPDIPGLSVPRHPWSLCTRTCVFV